MIMMQRLGIEAIIGAEITDWLVVRTTMVGEAVQPADVSATLVCITASAARMVARDTTRVSNAQLFQRDYAVVSLLFHSLASTAIAHASSGSLALPSSSTLSFKELSPDDNGAWGDGNWLTANCERTPETTMAFAAAWTVAHASCKKALRDSAGTLAFLRKQGNTEY